MKKRHIILYVLVMLILLTTSVYATINTSLDVKYKVNGLIKPGSEFEVTLYLKGLETDKNIKAVEGWINYDKNLLEPITIDSVVTGEDGKVKLDENNNLPVSDGSKDNTDLNKGIILNCNPNSNVKQGDCRLVVNFDTPINKETDLITLKFKIKSGVADGSYKDAIKYSLFTVFADDTQESKDLGDFSIEVVVGNKNVNTNETKNEVNNETNNEVKNETKNETQNEVRNETNNETRNEVKNETNNGVKNENTPNTPSTNTPNGNGGNNGNNGNGGSGNGGTQNPSSNISKQDETVSPTNLPKTGFRYIILPIFIMTIIGLVFYKKYSKYSKFDNK